MSEGFFERWSRRKQQVRTGEAPEELAKAVPQAVIDPAMAPATLPAVSGEDALPPEPAATAGPESQKPVLTLEDAQALTPESDFRPFVAKGVAPEVKNAAFKKLFADPHFNVMDGMDIYIDDYSKPSPIPDSVLRKMASAKFLKLFDEEPEETPRDDAMPDVAQSPHPGDVPSPPVADAQPASQEANDHHADLRLQPDDAPRAEDARDGTG